MDDDLSDFAHQKEIEQQEYEAKIAELAESQEHEE